MKWTESGKAIGLFEISRTMDWHCDNVALNRRHANQYHTICLCILKLILVPKTKRYVWFNLCYELQRNNKTIIMFHMWESFLTIKLCRVFVCVSFSRFVTFIWLRFEIHFPSLFTVLLFAAHCSHVMHYGLTLPFSDDFFTEKNKRNNIHMLMKKERKIKNINLLRNLF